MKCLGCLGTTGNAGDSYFHDFRWEVVGRFVPGTCLWRRIPE